MKMTYINNKHLEKIDIRFEVGFEEMQTVGIQLGSNPDKLVMLRMLQRVAERDVEKQEEKE